MNCVKGVQGMPAAATLQPCHFGKGPGAPWRVISHIRFHLGYEVKTPIRANFNNPGNYGGFQIGEICAAKFKKYA
jgi:hypothetical protein